MKHLNLFSLLGFACLFMSFNAAKGQNFILGHTVPIVYGHNMPYVRLSLGANSGYFLVDFATDTTVVDLNKISGDIPRHSLKNKKSFDIRLGNETYTPPYVYLQDFCNLQTGDVVQAGIIGTDILSKRIFTLDFKGKGLVYWPTGIAFNTDQQMRANGFVPISTVGYYSNNRKKNIDPKENIPTVPVTLGGVPGICQLDPGFDDWVVKYSVNINKAYLDALRKKGLHIQEVQGTRFLLSTCKPGVSDTSYQVQIVEGNTFAVTGTQMENALMKNNVAILVKSAAAGSKSCGGIGAADRPAAQIGLSILSEVPQMVFDPFTSRVWFKKE